MVFQKSVYLGQFQEKNRYEPSDIEIILTE